MATRNATPKRETVRVDPPVTQLDPTLEQLHLVNPDGSTLTNGKYNDRYEYCWVTKMNNVQMARYAALAYQMVRYRDDEVRPKHTYWTEKESTNKDDLIERMGMVLMKRPIEYRHREAAARRETREIIAGRFRNVSREDQQVARAAGAVMSDGGATPDHTFGL